MKDGKYRAQPLRRIYIQKEDGGKGRSRSPSLEDKIVQRATVDLLNAIYEQDFLECSYGFRPGRGAQDALDEVEASFAGGRSRQSWRQISPDTSTQSSGAAHGDDREEGQRWKNPAADREVDSTLVQSRTAGYS